MSNVDVIEQLYFSLKISSLLTTTPRVILSDFSNSVFIKVNISSIVGISVSIVITLPTCNPSTDTV